MSATDLIFGSTDEPRASAGLAVLRVTVGLSLALAHGLGKLPPAGFEGMLAGLGVPAPGLFAWISALTEFLGGLLLAVGLLTRPVAVAIAVNMAVAFFFAHAGTPYAERELAALYLFPALALLLTGGGRWSVDAAIAGRRG